MAAPNGQQAAQRLIYYADYFRTPLPPPPPLPALLPRPTTRSSAQCCWAIVQWQIKEKLKASEMKVAQVEDDDEAATQSAERKIEKILEKTLLISALKNCAMSPRRIHLLAA